MVTWKLPLHVPPCAQSNSSGQRWRRAFLSGPVGLAPRVIAKSGVVQVHINTLSRCEGELRVGSGWLTEDAPLALSIHITLVKPSTHCAFKIMWMRDSTA